MTIARFVVSAAVFALGVAGAGCGGDGLPREAISGVVTLDGRPLESGTITFMPVDEAASQSAGQATIAAGSYRIPAGDGLVPGTYRVSISSPVPADSPAARRGPAFDATSGTGADEAEPEVPLREAVPRRYNAESTLTAEVSAGGPNEFTYELESD